MERTNLSLNMIRIWWLTSILNLFFKLNPTPYSNILDLGIWCGLQVAVGKTYYMRRYDIDSLDQSVYDTWEK